MRWEVQSPKDHHWYYVVNTPIRHPDGTMSKMAMIQDVTAHKLTELALQEAEAKYRGIYENAVIGIFQITPSGRLLSVNPALARMYGYDSPEEMITGIMDLGRRSLWTRSNGMSSSARPGRGGNHPGPGISGIPPGRQQILDIGKRPGGAGRHRRHQLLRRVYPGHHGTEAREGELMIDLICHDQDLAKHPPHQA